MKKITFNIVLLLTILFVGCEEKVVENIEKKTSAVEVEFKVEGSAQKVVEVPVAEKKTLKPKIVLTPIQKKAKKNFDDQVARLIKARKEERALELAKIRASRE